MFRPNHKVRKIDGSAQKMYSSSAAESCRSCPASTSASRVLIFKVVQLFVRHLLLLLLLRSKHDSIQFAEAQQQNMKTRGEEKEEDDDDDNEDDAKMMRKRVCGSDDDEGRKDHA